jgi:hypothetical protein
MIDRQIDKSHPFRWAHEVEVENRMNGDPIFFDIAGKC